MFQLDDAAKFDDAIEFDAKPPAYALANSPLHRGSRRWPGADMTIDPDIAEVLGRYAIATRNAASTDVFGAATERDFPELLPQSIPACALRVPNYPGDLPHFRARATAMTLRISPGWQARDSSTLRCSMSPRNAEHLMKSEDSLGYLFPILAVLGEDRLCRD